ncbi:hypothetical protein AVEN_111611-1 [Araneus ventricosus]|uniref:Uncharacterized protein n=1 Tax=Araneus ventricosus TaxID=182803 RepID=A0A4Y2C5A1_ARAVE|nr:hypothetical protein AVEN_111611-1 [Araneus ventricosus]
MACCGEWDLPHKRGDNAQVSLLPAEDGVFPALEPSPSFSPFGYITTVASSSFLLLHHVSDTSPPPACLGCQPGPSLGTPRNMP